jgi:hypothetical protein
VISLIMFKKPPINFHFTFGDNVRNVEEGAFSLGYIRDDWNIKTKKKMWEICQILKIWHIYKKNGMNPRALRFVVTMYILK